MADRNKTAIDLDGLEVAELTALIAQAEAKRAEKLEDAKSALLDEFREKAAGMGLSLEALVRGGPAPRSSAVPAARRKARSDAGSTLSAKYRGPNGEEWTGRGRRPKWIAALEAEGHSLDEYRL